MRFADGTGRELIGERDVPAKCSEVGLPRSDRRARSAGGEHAEGMPRGVVLPEFELCIADRGQRSNLVRVGRQDRLGGIACLHEVMRGEQQLRPEEQRGTTRRIRRQCAIHRLPGPAVVVDVPGQAGTRVVELAQVRGADEVLAVAREVRRPNPDGLIDPVQ